ncbi:hypothetical protein HanRHA438_Chr07g0303571 [Helianthus annuus]|nr:hypothetical protein HanRHA438_Chr07g0303571 [Helianthus annuus]
MLLSMILRPHLLNVDNTFLCPLARNAGSLRLVYKIELPKWFIIQKKKMF